MKKPDRKLRVGVTINIKEGSQSLWENGIGQNCVFLAQLLATSPEIESSVLVNAKGHSASDNMLLDGAGVKMIGLEEAASTLDILIEMGVQLPDAWAKTFRHRGGRYAAMRVGNDYAIDIERALFDKPHASLCSSKCYDAVWTIPGHSYCCRDYFTINTRCPVRIVPHLWSPHFFQRSVDNLPDGIHFGYRSGRKRWRLACFEPNINLVKTSIVPLLLCEEAYRKNPSFLEFFRVSNTLRLKDQPSFKKLALSLDITTHGLATFEGRFPVGDFLARHSDCIISHQWGCPQNYLYYETLYGRYPLVHNSELLKGYGYYYPDFNCQEGAAVLLDAFHNHDLQISEYNEKCSEIINNVDIRNPLNIETYTRELLGMYDPSVLS